MTKIKKIALTKLLKLEFPELVNDVIVALEEHNPTALKLQDALEMVVALQPKLNKLTTPYGPHPLTKKMDVLHEKRLTYAALITMLMRVLHKANSPEMREMIEISRPVVRLHLNYLRQNNRTFISQSIRAFFFQLEEYPEVRNALDTLGFKHYLSEMEKANNLLEELYMKRLNQTAKRPKVDTAGILFEAQFVVRKLFEQIEFYQYMHQKVNYEPLVNQLNEVIARFTGLINMRATCGKTRKQKATAKALQAVEKTEIEQSQAKTLASTDQKDHANNKKLTTNEKKEDSMPFHKIKNRNHPDYPVQKSKNTFEYADKGSS